MSDESTVGDYQKYGPLVVALLIPSAEALGFTNYGAFGSVLLGSMVMVMGAYIQGQTGGEHGE